MKRFCLFSILLFSMMSIAVASSVPGYQYVYPKDNATRVTPQTTIIVRFDEASPQLLENMQKFIRVRDDHRIISGTTRIASDNRTVIFEPDELFEHGATVSVTLEPVFAKPSIERIEKHSFVFHITPIEPLDDLTANEEINDNTLSQSSRELNKPTAGQARIMPNGVSVPSDFPHIDVSVNKAPGEGYIFLNNRGRGTPYNIIFDNDGSPVWYLRTTDRRRDFKVQRNGTITMLARHGGHRFLNFDQDFNFLAEYRAVDGYSTDEHECIILENANVLLIGRRNENVDMSAYVSGGRKNATVRECCIQEFTAEHDKIFEWRAWDHFEDVIQFLELENLQGDNIRFPHMNSIDIDDDGHIILSSRHLSEVSKINRHTGEFIWRLGGPENQFEFVNDDLNGFKNQHSALALGDNHYSVFDNGTSRNPKVSRGVEYKLDVENMTATLMWEYRNPPGTEYSHYMGNHQRLPNGNSLINWAVTSRPKATEVTPNGEVVYEMNWASPDECYRTFRCPWNGNVEKPSLYVEQGLEQVKLIFNKFGDPDVEYYNIYGGPTRHSTALLDTSKKTIKTMTNLENNTVYNMRVTAVYPDGSESDYSNEERVIVQNVAANVNLVPNGDFSRNKAAWIYELQGGEADWVVEDGVTHFKISNGGNAVYAVQLRQNQMPLVQGEKYLFEFDAWAVSPRTIEAKVGQDESPWINYSKIGLSGVGPAKRHYSYEFNMEDPSDPNGRVVINVGDNNADVYVDNVSLKLIDETAIREKPQELKNYKLFGAYPNPFNSSTTIRFQLPQANRVSISLYNILGQLEKQLYDQLFTAGVHDVPVDASDLTSGVYFYNMQASAIAEERTFSDTGKLILIK